MEVQPQLQREVMNIPIRLELPEDIARRLEAKWNDLPRAALESLLAEAYRSELISAEQLRRLLGFATRFETEEFLRQRDIYDYTLEDFEEDRKTLRDLPSRG